jgi:hypothetical protein
MSRTAETLLPFGTEERKFRLGLGELRAVQEKCDAGPGELAQRLAPLVRALRAKLTFGEILAAGMMGSWRVDDVREPILQGLIGGGMNPTEAGVLVRQVFDPRPLALEHLTVAFTVLTEGYLPPEDEPVAPPGEPKAGAKPRRSRAAKSTSAP